LPRADAPVPNTRSDAARPSTAAPLTNRFTCLFPPPR
jgi:hypothetical protein